MAHFKATVEITFGEAQHDIMGGTEVVTTAVMKLGNQERTFYLSTATRTWFTDQPDYPADNTLCAILNEAFEANKEVQ